MDINAITTLIGSVGFPIVCSLYLVYTNSQNELRHQQEIEKLRDTVENNTKVMIKLCTKLGIEDAD